MRHVEAGQRRGHSGPLRDFTLEQRSDELCTGSDDDAIGLRIGTVTGIADRIEDAGAIRVVENRSPAIVPAVRLGLRKVELPLVIDQRHRAVIIRPHGIGRIDDQRRVGVGDVQIVDGRNVSHEGQVLTVGRQIQRYFGLRGKTGDQVVGQQRLSNSAGAGN